MVSRLKANSRTASFYDLMSYYRVTADRTAVWQSPQPLTEVLTHSLLAQHGDNLTP